MSETNTKIELLFNPEELAFSKSNTWDAGAAPGKNAPAQQFSSGGAVTFSLDALFDTTTTGAPVTTITDKLYALMLTDDSLQGSKPERNMSRPPWVQFHWGSLTSFKAIVNSLSIKYTYFAADGTPLRAECALSLTQFEDEGTLAPQNPTSGTPTIHKVRPTQSGEYLDTIAFEVYGKAGNWRAIAEANGITDPLDMRPGRVLVIPQLEE